MQLKGGEGVSVEAQRFGAVRQRPGKIGARPVEHRHKVVAHRFDAAGGQIAYRLLIVGDIALIVSALCFDRLVHRNAFYHRPDQIFFRQQRLTRFNFLHRPDITVGDMVQRGHNAGRARLARIV